MYNKNIKLVIAGLIVAWAIYAFSQGNIWSGIFILLLAGIFILLYYKNEFILMSFLRMRKQDFAGAEKWLNKIKNPESALVKKQQGYYNFLKGIMTSQRNLTQAEKYFRKAVNLGMSMQHDLAMAKLQLAGIAMAKRRKREATMLMNEAKKLDKHGMLKDQIAQLKQQMKRL
jgi:tetratricopeptide (TPR) repeat protein